MPSGSMPSPGKFSRAISAEVRSVMARKQVTGAELSRITDRSQSYLSKRLRGEAQFTANDVEDICRALKVDLLSLLTAAVRSAQR